MRSVFFLSAMLFCAQAQSSDNKNIGEWTQAELNASEQYMSTLTKNECEYKNIAFLKNCDTDNCLMLIAGAGGDCVTFAKGSMAEFCKNYEINFKEQYCGGQVKNRKVCELYKISKAQCENI